MTTLKTIENSSRVSLKALEVAKVITAYDVTNLPERDLIHISGALTEDGQHVIVVHTTLMLGEELFLPCEFMFENIEDDESAAEFNEFLGGLCLRVANAFGVPVERLIVHEPETRIRINFVDVHEDAIAALVTNTWKDEK